MNKEHENEDMTSENLQKEFDEIQSKLIRIQEGYIDMAMRAGYSIDAIRTAKNNFSILSNKLDEHPEYSPIISSAYTQAVSLNYSLQSLEFVRPEDLNIMTLISRSLMTICSTSGSIIKTLDVDFTDRLDTPSFLIPDDASIYEKLAKLSQPLANTYKEIEQVFYATNADNTRAALPMMRQAFDYFFAIIAPDNDVRVSEFWQEKLDEDKPELVTRHERIRYAIATQIKNQENAEAFVNNVDLIVKSYKVLNRLHERGELNQEAAKQALLSVKHFLEDFASSLR